MIGRNQMTIGLLLCIVVMVTSETQIRSSSDELDVYIPGSQRIVYDYQMRLVVYRFFEEETDDFGPCYAREMGESETYVPKGKRTGRKPVDEDDDDEDRSPLGWIKTTNQVPEDVISGRVERMCKEAEFIYWLEEDKGGIVAKTSARCTYINTCHKCGWLWGSDCCTTSKVC